MLVAQKDTITKITGIITPKSIDTLKNELGGAFTIIKSTHFVDGQRYGFLASMIPQEKYQVVICNPAWVYVAPANPGTYSAAAVVAGVSAAQREHIATPDGYVYCEIHQGIYGLPQAGIIVQELLAKRLKEHGYSQSATTPGLWKHEWRLVWFSLVVDNFGVKYIDKEHAQHLLQTVKKYYKCSFEPEGERYCGLTIKWDYPGKKVHIAMPFYLENALKQFQHPPLIVPQDQPHPQVKKEYGAKV